jgi:hypothetical protein
MRMTGILGKLKMTKVTTIVGGSKYIASPNTCAFLLVAETTYGKHRPHS